MRTFLICLVCVVSLAAAPTKVTPEVKAMDARLLAGAWFPPLSKENRQPDKRQKNKELDAKRLALATKVVTYLKDHKPTEGMNTMLDGKGANGGIDQHRPQLGMTKDEVELFGQYSSDSETATAHGKVDQGTLYLVDAHSAEEGWHLVYVDKVLKQVKAPW